MMNNENKYVLKGHDNLSQDYALGGLAEVCEVIAANMGLHFPIEMWNVLSRNLTLAAGEFGFQHFSEFTEWLLSANLKKEQIRILASYLTISETYFWREEPVFAALTDVILPELIASKQNGAKKIRIWSAGCSTGEEAYSLAIALHRIIPDISDWQIMVLGTDMNPKVLKKATSGIYTQWSFRTCPSWLKTNYFNHQGNENYEIIPEIRNMVTFSNLNLTEDSYPSVSNNTCAMDIIFCRNVLMYFTDDWISKISGNLFHSLNPDGWFVVSSCELSAQRFPQFQTVNFPGAVFYQKSGKEFSPSWRVPAFNSNPGITFPKPTEKQVVFESTVTPSIPEPVVDPFFLTSDFNLIDANLYIEDQTVKELFLEKERHNDNSIQIRLLANRGELSEALSLCNEVIRSDKLSTGLYFLRASILQELNQISEAVASVKQAIYLNPNFIMGHFVLGNLSLQDGKLKQAKKYFDNVTDLLYTCSADDILPGSEGLSVKYMLENILPDMQKNMRL